MTIRFSNTLGGGKQDFEPLAPPRVTMYVCGPTVYDVPHVGHARSAIVFDIVRRHLAWRGYDVLFVRNVTDVDDKIINRANELGVDPAVVADRYTRAYDEAMASLGVLPPDVAPRATGHLIEMQELIAELVDGGFAYAGEGSVYFAVEKFADYGKLSRRGLDVLANRERVAPAPGKLHPLDFALWKAAKPGEPAWPSPWGPGRPGWHIECSVMAARYLGQPFDIHGGGDDLVFPHHENEIAQSEAQGTAFARYWLHNGQLNIRGESMSKSLKNYVEIGEVLADYPAQVLRLFFCGAHYRSLIDYTASALDEARAVWERFRGLLRAASPGDADETAVAGHLEDFGRAMDDDLNTPQALAGLHELVSSGHAALERGDARTAAELRQALATGLGVLGCSTEAGTGTDLVDPLVTMLLSERDEARRSKAYDRADAIRDRLTELGIVVEDSAEGSRWYLP